MLARSVAASVLASIFCSPQHDNVGFVMAYNQLQANGILFIDEVNLATVFAYVS